MVVLAGTGIALAGGFGFTPVLVAAGILALVGLVVVLVMTPRISA